MKRVYIHPVYAFLFIFFAISYELRFIELLGRGMRAYDILGFSLVPVAMVLLLLIGWGKDDRNEPPK